MGWTRSRMRSQDSSAEAHLGECTDGGEFLGGAVGLGSLACWIVAPLYL